MLPPRDETTIDIREVLVWCLPALILAIALRVVISAGLPFGYYHYDTHDFMLTPDRYLNEGKWDLHKKKVPLVPAIYVAASTAGVPLLRAMPLLQHVAGVAATFVFALLLRAVCPMWRALIIPGTVLFALCPAIIWYEHTLLAESLFLVFITCSALCATLHHAKPRWTQWLLLLAALSAAALTSPEGKLLMVAAPLLLLAAHHRDWRRLASKGAALVLWGLVLMPATRTSQTGLMPLASVIHWMPDQTKAAKGAEPLLLPIREQARAVQGKRQRHETATRKALSAAVRQFFTDNPGTGNPRSDRDVNDFCRRLALEIYCRNWLRVPALALEKYLMTLDEFPSGRFDEHWLKEELRDSLARNWDRVLRLSRQLSGETWRNESEAAAFFDHHFQPDRVTWFDSAMVDWQRLASWPRWPGRPSGHGGIFALPAFYALAVLGCLSACLIPGPWRTLHICWLLALAGMAFGVFAVAGTEARFRFAFEPFAILYLAVFIGTLISVTKTRLSPRHPAKDHAAPATASALHPM